MSQVAIWHRYTVAGIPSSQQRYTCYCVKIATLNVPVTWGFVIRAAMVDSIRLKRVSMSPKSAKHYCQVQFYINM